MTPEMEVTAGLAKCGEMMCLGGLIAFAIGSPLMIYLAWITFTEKPLNPYDFMNVPPPKMPPPPEPIPYDSYFSAPPLPTKETLEQGGKEKL